MLEKGAKVLDGAIAVRKISLTVLITVCLFWCGGCNLLEGAASDIQGWDISACVNGFGVCWELFFDNADKFEDGFVAAMDGLATEGG